MQSAYIRNAEFSLRFLWPEHGQDLVEYALVFALIAFGATAGMKALADGINTAFSKVSTDPRQLHDLTSGGSHGSQHQIRCISGRDTAGRSIPGPCLSLSFCSFPLSVIDNPRNRQAPTLNLERSVCLTGFCSQSASLRRSSTDMLLSSAPENDLSLMLIEGGLTLIAFAIALCAAPAGIAFFRASSEPSGDWRAAQGLAVDRGGPGRASAAPCHSSLLPDSAAVCP